MKLSRKTKKKIRAIILCYTGNPKCRKRKYSKSEWWALRNDFKVWLKLFTMEDRRTANTVN